MALALRELTLSAVCAVALLSFGGCKKETPTSGTEPARDGGAATSIVPASQGRLKIAVVPKGTTHEFWKSVHAGVVKAAKEMDVDVVWKGPLKEDDLKGQIDVVNTFVAQGVNGIVVAPLNDSALRAPVRAAKEAKIPSYSTPTSKGASTSASSRPTTSPRASSRASISPRSSSRAT